jgi:hypothetical protein
MGEDASITQPGILLWSSTPETIHSFDILALVIIVLLAYCRSGMA